VLYLDVHDGGRRVDELIKSPRINCHCTPVLSQARCTTKMCRRSLSTVGPLHDILQPPGHRPPRSKECSVEPQPSMQSTTFVGRHNGFMTRDANGKISLYLYHYTHTTELFPAYDLSANLPPAVYSTLAQGPFFGP